MAGPAEQLREQDTTQWALRERVKELTCLYGIAQVAGRRDLRVDDMAAHVAALLPPAWQYPECAAARMTIDGQAYLSGGFEEAGERLAAPILVGSVPRGRVEVCYSEQRPPADEGPFLKEERSLINEAARQVSLMLERLQAREERHRLEEQLRHADRLATIGRLAAGVAHELNEPLGAILGFAQLTQKNFGLPDQTGRDLEKIVKASLRARDIVRKLLIFARQAPAQKLPVDLNRVVHEGLYLLAGRCAEAKIEVERRLDPARPSVNGDANLLQQVVMNLAANAVHAMPQGGRLLVATAADGDIVTLVVEDSGKGMSDEVKRQIFTPFFTTKDVGEGTGLGLAVVHGIVAEHGGRIEVETRPDQGSRFEIQFPRLLAGLSEGTGKHAR